MNCHTNRYTMLDDYQNKEDRRFKNLCWNLLREQDDPKGVVDRFSQNDVWDTARRLKYGDASGTMTKWILAAASVEFAEYLGVEGESSTLDWRHPARLLYALKHHPRPKYIQAAALSMDYRIHGALIAFLREAGALERNASWSWGHLSTDQLSVGASSWRVYLMGRRREPLATLVMRYDYDSAQQFVCGVSPATDEDRQIHHEGFEKARQRRRMLARQPRPCCLSIGELIQEEYDMGRRR